MKIGLIKERKPGEGRVALLPAQVAQLVDLTHTVLVEAEAGLSAGIQNADYQKAGAEIVTAQEAWQAQCIVKVKEPLEQEYDFLRSEMILVTCLHTANNSALTNRLLESGCTAFAAEDSYAYGSPNSPLAGEVAALEGIRLCWTPFGGAGRHFAQHYGAAPLTALVVGLGASGRGALRVLSRLGVRTLGTDQNPATFAQAELEYGTKTIALSALADHLPYCDLVLNCVRWDKSRDDHLITRAMLQTMRSTAVIVDVACDPAGAIETSRATSWYTPVYTTEGIRHYVVDNLPGAVPVTASAGYAHALLPHIQAIAELGPLTAARRNAVLARGLVCADGVLFHEETAKVQKRAHSSFA